MICAHTRSGKEEFWLLANAFQRLTLESITRREILLRSKGRKKTTKKNINRLKKKFWTECKQEGEKEKGIIPVLPK